MQQLRHVLALLFAALLLPVGITAQDGEIWVSFIDNPNRESNGVYGFPADNPAALVAKKTSSELFFQKGTGYQDGVIYGMDYQQGFFTADRYILYGIDTKDWSVTSRDVDKQFVIQETANGMDGTVYALFADGKLGVMDYKTLKRTDICRPTRTFKALGVNSINELYGIDSGGNLVRIDTGNGKETVIGKVGASFNAGSRFTGEIDPVTNMFYIAVRAGGSGLTVYAVDLNTCEAVDKGHLPAGYENLGGMVIVGEPAAKGSPARATNLQATFEGSSLSGTFSFTVPTETFDHQPLEGDVAYTVVYGNNGQQTATGTAAAGATVTLPLTLDEGGNVTFTVKLSNAAGEGQSASVSLWIGPDAPLAPQHVLLTMDKDGLATLTWTAPTACVNDGYLGTLTYDVYRIVSGDETLVARSLSETTFTEQHQITTLKEYSYAVVAVNEGTPSVRALSNKVVAGDGFGVPYVEDFGPGNHLDYFTIVNVNGDSDRWGELTWKLHTETGYWGDGKSYEEMIVQTGGATDDWLITPPVQLHPGHAYALKFRMKAGYEENKEKFEVKMGRAATVGDMTTTLLGEQTINHTSYKSYLREFSVDEAGSYCFGFHATPNTGFALYLDDIEVRENASQDAPGKVTALTITPDAGGALTADIAFNAPVTTIGGAGLQSITKIEVLRNEKLVKTFSQPAPGQSCSFSDQYTSNGYYVYTVIAYNDKGNGLRCESEPVYVGVDVPLAPVVTRIEDHGTSVRFEWAEVPAVGQRGFVVRPEEVTYEVWSTDIMGKKDKLLYSGKERSLQANYTDTDAFDIAKWLIVAKNKAGSSQYGAAKIATGYPLTLPYRETFAMGTVKTSVWTEQSGVRSFNPSTEDAVAGDAGSILFVPYQDGDNSSFNTQRLVFAGVKQPELKFFYKLEAGSLVVKGWQPSGDETVFFTAQADGSDEAHWHSAVVNLTPLKQQPFVVVKFLATGQAGKRIFIDDVDIYDGAYTDGIDNSQFTLHNSQFIIHNSQFTIEDSQIYDLQGRRVSSSQLRKGLYIINGKKYIKNK